MIFDRTFKVFLFISFLIHGVILASLPKFNTELFNKSIQQLEITYQKLQITSNLSNKKLSNDKVVLEAQKIPVNKDDGLLSKFFKSSDFFKKAFEVSKKPAAPQTDTRQKKVVIPELKSDIKSPAYKSYYQSIREKIREVAYQNYARYEVGEVYLTFMLLADGTLKNVKVFDDRSSADDYLKDIAVGSIKEASPYPSFPEDLGYPELSFNVIISFEVGD